MSATSNDLRGGALVLNKPAGITSHDAVAKIRKLYGTKKVGHTGTLDPMATGVLVILVGRAVKLSEILTAGRKKYRAKMCLGMKSDTEDTTGTLTYSDAPIPDKKAVLEAVRSFTGDIMQVPPMYSALKTGGQKLVDLARHGITVEREARHVKIYSISAEGEGSEYTLDVECSKGTYIRTLCADIGEKLGCGAVMGALDRLEACGFGKDKAYELSDLEKMTPEERDGALIGCEELFASCPSVVLPPFYTRLALNGCEIYQNKIHAFFTAGTLLRVYGSDGFIGLGEVIAFPDGDAIKIKIFL